MALQCTKGWYFQIRLPMGASSFSGRGRIYGHLTAANTLSAFGRFNQRGGGGGGGCCSPLSADSISGGGGGGGGGCCPLSANSASEECACML